MAATGGVWDTAAGAYGAEVIHSDMTEETLVNTAPQGPRELADWEDSAGKALVVLQDGLNLLAGAFTQLQAERSAMRSELGRLQQQHSDDQAELQRHAAFAERVAEIAVVAERLGLGTTLPAGLLTELQGGPDDVTDVSPALAEAPTAVAASAPAPPPRVVADAPAPVALGESAADESNAPVVPGVVRVRRGRRFVPAVLGLLTGIVGLVFAAALAAVIVPGVSALELHRVDSGTMAPAIPSGALVAGTGSRAGRLAPGSLALFEAPNGSGWVTRRIRSAEFVGESLQVTTGTEDGSADPWVLDGNARVYRFRFFVPLLGYPLAGLDSLAGKVVTVAIPLALLVPLAFALRRSLRVGTSAVE